MQVDELQGCLKDMEGKYALGVSALMAENKERSRD